MERVDRRQFIIMDKPYEREDFEHVSLCNGYVLSYQKELNVLKNGDIILLGYAYSVKGQEIVLSENALREKRYWAGRWVLIYKDQIYPDVNATLSLCYGYTEKQKLCVSSSIHLLNNILNRKNIADFKVKHGDGNGTLDYYPIPNTPFRGIKKLLPSQYIDYSNKECIQVQLDWLCRSYKDKSYEWIRNKIIEEMTIEFKNISKDFGDEIWITLTGGVDSRALAAVAKYSGVKFNTYTAIRNKIQPWDKEYPVKISKKISVNHIYIDDTAPPDEKRKLVFDEHCSSCAVGTERQQYISGSDIPIKNRAMVLWGTVWPAYIKAYWNYFDKGETIENCLNEINQKCAGILDKSNVHYSSLYEWLKYVEENPVNDLDWRERMYIEQRNAAWVGAASQAIDLFDSVRIAPVNCQEIMELLLSLDVKPGDKKIQKDIVAVCCPELKGIPYGERTDIFYRVMRKLRKMFSR